MLTFKDYLVESEDPCWKGYEMIGMKKKNGKEVPNCVPKEEVEEELEEQVTTNKISNGEFEVYLDGKKTKYRIYNGSAGVSGYGKNEYGIHDTESNKHTIVGSLQKAKKQVEYWLKKQHEDLDEATYKGKDVPLNKPMAGDVKKSKVYVDPDGDGKAKKVEFGDPNMTIKKHIPARRKSFRARHKCDTAKDKTTARYWSCKNW